MANNIYTSPRVYLSRGAGKSRIKTKRNFELGIGYTVPEGVSASDFKKEYAKWEQKLQNSGFNDIEYRSPSHTGHFTPFFRENGSTATFQALYDPFKQEYFQLATEFGTYMDEVVSWCDPVTLKKRRTTRWRLAFDDKHLQYKHLWRLHIEGVPYRAVAKAFSGRPTKWMRSLDPVPKRLIRKTCTEFWTHQHTSYVLNIFWKWMSDRGYSDPR